MFRNQIIWNKNQGQSMTKQFMQSHDVILFYCKGRMNSIFNIQREPYKTKPNGTYNYYAEKYNIERAEERWALGKMVQDVWSFAAKTNKTYPTQKPFKLLERIICSSTK